MKTDSKFKVVRKCDGKSFSIGLASCLTPFLVSADREIVPLAKIMHSKEAHTYTVTNLSDSGSGSLRQAITDANTNPGADIIQFADGLAGHLVLTSSLDITDSVNVHGSGADVLAIISSGGITNSVQDVTISGFTLKFSSQGITNSGTLTLDNCVLSQATQRATINKGTATLTIINSILSGNRGGAVFNESSGNVTITNSTLVNNNPNLCDYGGAIYNEAGTVTITNSTLSSNGTFWCDFGGYGGAIYNKSGTVTIINSTISGSGTQNQRGGAIYNGSSGTIVITNGTVSGHLTSSEALYNDKGGILIVGNSLIAGNNSSIYNDGIFYSDGHNLFGQGGNSGITGAQLHESDLILAGTIDTTLSPLADNGGPTQTHALVDGSPAINAGNNFLIPNDVTTDQRGAGYARIFNKTVDIGAFEFGSAPVIVKLTLQKIGTGEGDVISDPAGIDCGATCQADFMQDTPITLTATADAGSIFSGWSGAGCKGTETCQLTMTTAQTVKATFNKNYKLSINKSGNGTVTSTDNKINCGTGAGCSASYAANTQVTLNATADSGYQFTGWNGAGCSGTDSCIVTMTANQTVTATFSEGASNLLVVTKSGTGAGTVTSQDAGINCGTDCTKNYPSGTQVTLTAQETNGSSFTGWNGDCGGTNKICTVTMDQARTINAGFIQGNSILLAVVKKGAGTGTIISQDNLINCGADCTQKYAIGTMVTLSAQADVDSNFKGWSNPCSGTGTCQITINDTNKIISPVFTFKPKARLTVELSGKGAVTSNPAGINCGIKCQFDFVRNTSVTLTANPGSGASFAGWSGVCLGTALTCTITMDQAKTVNAFFQSIQRATLTVKPSPMKNGLVQSSPDGIYCGVACSYRYLAGTQVTLIATPDTGYRFNGWSDKYCTTSGLGDCTLILNVNKSVQPSFVKIIKYRLTVTNPKVAGTIISVSDAGINCGNGGNDCDEDYDQGKTVVLERPQPAAGYTFTGWESNGVNSCVGTGACVLLMNMDRIITAQFTK